MGLDKDDPPVAANTEETRRRLSSEVTEIEGAIAMITNGSASRVTLSGLRFGEELARRFRAEAESKGVLLEPILWPEDVGCDLIVRRIDE
jgi:hypothetical protein